MIGRLVTKLLNGHQSNREPSLAWLPAYKPKKHQQRVKRLQFNISRSRLVVISLRRFATRPDRRSRRYRQLVFRIYIFSFREVAIAVQRRKPAAQPVQGLRYTQSLAASLFLVFVGILGGIYFGFHLKGPAQLYVNPPTSGPGQAPSQTVLNYHSKIQTKIKQANLKYTAAFAKLPPPPPSQIIVPPKLKTMPKSLPVRLVIPRIGIDTGVLPIGLKPTGAIALPDSFEEVGWYNQGPTPGERGPAIIVGHVDSTQGVAIFWRLREMIPGDTFQVYRADGSVATFKVLEVEQFSQATFPTENVYGNIRYAGIRLITCSGTFDTQTRHYDHNTVVYAALQ